MENGNIPAKGEAISDAISIVNGLQVSLNHEPNAELSSNFDALYDYMQRRLFRANADNDSAAVLEVVDLLNTLHQAWDAIGDQAPQREHV